MKYEIYGPYALPKRRAAKGKVLNLSARQLGEFWDGIKEDEGIDLRQGRGCYLFAHKAAGGFKPWYVGQSKGPFVNEVFTAKNKGHYVEVYNDLGAATPVIFLISRLTTGEKLSKRSLSAKEAGFIEQKLIGLALAKNSKLINVANTKHHKGLVIPGIHNHSGSLSRAAKDLRTALGIKDPVKKRTKAHSRPVVD